MFEEPTLVRDICVLGVRVLNAHRAVLSWPAHYARSPSLRLPPEPAPACSPDERSEIRDSCRLVSPQIPKRAAARMSLRSSGLRWSGRLQPLLPEQWPRL